MTGRVPTAVFSVMMTAIVVLLAPPLSAQTADGPEAAVHDLLDALEADSLDDLDGLVCEERQAAIRDTFDVAADLPDGVDTETIAGAVDLFITDRTVELIEETGERAEVRIGGRLRALVDAALVRRLAELSLGAFGTQVGSGQIDELVDQLTADLQAGSPIADDVTVTREGSAWLVCDDIAVGQGAAAPSDAGEGMCVYLTVSELNAIDEERGGAGFDGYARSSWDEETGLCTYDEGEDGIGSVKLGRFDYPFEEVLAALTGTDEMVAGRPAYLSGNDLFVQLVDGILYVNAPAKGMPDGQVDYLTMPAGVAELVLSRIDDRFSITEP